MVNDGPIRSPARTAGRIGVLLSYATLGAANPIRAGAEAECFGTSHRGGQGGGRWGEEGRKGK
jgi:hypothetical protein